MISKLGKTLFAFAVAMTLTLSLTATAMAAENNQITVNGKGVVSVEPDLATLHFSIETRANTAEEAQQQNAEISQNVINAIKGIGVSDDEIKTNSYRVYPTYKYDDKTDERKLVGFEVSNNLYMTTGNVNDTGKYLDVIVKAGATGNDGVEFSVKDPTIHYAEALKLAVVNAKSSADTIAAALNVTLGSPVSAIENYSNSSYASRGSGMDQNAGSAKAEMSVNDSADIRYDKIKITASLDVAYQFN